MKKRILILLLLVITAFLTKSCNVEDSELGNYTPDFTITSHPTDSNVYIFENITKGDHYYYRWIFGNGERIDRTQIDNKEITSFYAAKGNYEVELTVWGNKSDLSDNKTISKNIDIENNIFSADFTISEVDGKTNTFILQNTTTGQYDKAIWLVNGKEIESDNTQLELYYSFKGTYDVSLKILNGNYEKIVDNKITVINDDSEFMNHYSLVWNDEFDGTSINTDKWKFETGDHGWGNNEWQNYTDNRNVTVSDGTLKIEAKLIGDGQKVGDYTSTRLNQKESFTYGIYEVKGKMPDYKGPGVWPAIWMLGESIQTGTSWPLCGEIDIMEYVSWDPNKVSSTIHIESNNHRKGNSIGTGHLSLETAEEEFHIYGIIWTENFLKFYRDDVSNILLTYNKPAIANDENWPFDKPFYYLLNIAVGGDYGGVNGVDDSNFPSTMEVDYVRVYQLSE